MVKYKKDFNRVFFVSSSCLVREGDRNVFSFTVSRIPKVQNMNKEKWEKVRISCNKKQVAYKHIPTDKRKFICFAE